MPKNFHNQLYPVERIQLLKSDEHHLSANEHFLLQLIQDLSTEIIKLKTQTKTTLIKEIKMADKEQLTKQIIAERLAVSMDRIIPQALFVEELGADSLDQVELIMAFEDEFSIEIPDEDAEKIKTVKDAVDYINSKT